MGIDLARIRAAPVVGPVNDQAIKPLRFHPVPDLPAAIRVLLFGKRRKASTWYDPFCFDYTRLRKAGIAHRNCET